MIAGAACTDDNSATDLNPAGPPEILQVRLKERYTDTASNDPTATQRVCAFGSHPQATAGQSHDVTTAYAGADATEAVDTDHCGPDDGSGTPCTGTNHIRVIFDELLLGNNLEEIECNDGSFQKVPVAATPDDIANCSVPADILPATCKGQNAVCLCDNDAGCTVVSSTSPAPLMYAKGEPVGVRDENGDGAADVFRFIDGAVGITCGGINVPLDLDEHSTSANEEFTFWQPSGNQQIPATGGFEALGPAVILKPLGPMPTNVDCGLVFSPDVVDKQGQQVCAPPAGRPADGSETPDCSPGDVSAVTWHTEPVSLIPGVADNSTGVNRTDPLQLSGNVPLDSASLAGITVLEGATPFTQFTAALDAMTGRTIIITWTGGLAANTMYTVTVPASLKDTFMQAMPAPFVLHFTTGS